MWAADWATKRFGTLEFLVLHLIFLAIWIFINLGIVPLVKPFDPYPFILLTMIASFEAIILTIIVLISHNRQADTGIRRDELELAVNLIAEQELTMALRLLVEVNKLQGGKLYRDPKLAQMLEDTDVGKLQKTLENQLTPAL